VSSWTGPRNGLWVVCAIATATVFGSASADAAVIGTRDLTGWKGTYACQANPCTFSNVRVSDGTAQSPVKGRIKRWRVNAHASGTVRLQVLRRTVDNPGHAADEFMAVRQSEEESAIPGLNTFDASLRVGKGNFIGLAVVSGGDLVRSRFANSARFGVQHPAFSPGDAATPFSDFNVDHSALLFNASVRD